MSQILNVCIQLFDRCPTTFNLFTLVLLIFLPILNVHILLFDRCPSTFNTFYFFKNPSAFPSCQSHIPQCILNKVFQWQKYLFWNFEYVIHIRTYVVYFNAFNFWVLDLDDVPVTQERSGNTIGNMRLWGWIKENYRGQNRCFEEGFVGYMWAYEANWCEGKYMAYKGV